MSTQLLLPFGHTTFNVELSTANLLGSLTPRPCDSCGDELELLHTALAHPIGVTRLSNIARPGQKVAIVTSDMTRPCPSKRLLPLLLAELTAAGIPDKDIMIVAALGLHRPMTGPELEVTVGSEIYRRIRVVNHDPQNTIRLGVTAQGTPVEFFRPIVEADLRICLGNLEFHYFAGYSGGAKAILPGCASQATVQANHALMIQPHAVAGQIEENPVRRDLEEGAAMLGVDFTFNVIVDSQHRIVEAVAGEVMAAHRRGCELVKARGAIAISRQADIVLVSAGGYPKDLNLYQAQKALNNAVCAVRLGGIIILVAECPEGLGNQIFEAWMTEADSPNAILGRIQRDFRLGGRKAAAYALAMTRALIYLVSTLPSDFARSLGFYPFDNPAEALQAALTQAGSAATVTVLPEGGSVLPLLEQPVEALA